MPLKNHLMKSKEMENDIIFDELFNGLSRKEQDAAFFHGIMGYSCKETAALMGLSNSAVRQILSRASKKMSESRTCKMRASGYARMSQNGKKRP